MTPTERKLLMFLVRDRLCELNDWEYSPCRGELRQKLEAILSELQAEAAAIQAGPR